MKTYIVNLMQSFFASPQGPARLYAYARRAGMDVTYLNLNHDAYSWLLSEQTLGTMLRAARPGLLAALARDRYLRRDFGAVLVQSSNGQLVGLLAGILTGEISAGRWWAAMPLAGKVLRAVARHKLHVERLGLVLLSHADEVARHIGAAQREMDHLYMRQSPRDFLALFQTLLCGKAIIDALHYPAQMDFGFGFWGTEYETNAADLIRATDDKRHNFLIPFLSSQVMPRLLADQPGLVGLSATHSSELFGAFTLAAMIKRQMPDAHMVLGGASVADIRDRIARNAGLWDCIDSLVYGPGEIPLLELAQAVESARPLTGVPNLVYRDAHTGQVRYSDRTAELNPDDFVTPEYLNLRPGAGLALETSTSCYWGKCAFCYYPRHGSSSRDHLPTPSRSRSLDRVLEDMRVLRDRHDPCLIGFTDSAIPPDRLARIAELNVSTGLNVPFSAFVRLEKEFADPQFCRKLAQGGFLGGQAGLEAATPAVNQRINKGIDLSLAPAIFRSYRRNDLLLHLYTVVGFAGETLDQAWNTYRFVRRHHRLLTLDWQVYSLWVVENGPLAENGQAFGLRNVQPLPDDLLLPLCTYDVSDGMSQAQSITYSLLFEDKLRPLRHGLSSLMDVESYKLVLFVWQAGKWRQSHRTACGPHFNGPARPGEVCAPSQAAPSSQGSA